MRSGGGESPEWFLALHAAACRCYGRTTVPTPHASSRIAVSARLPCDFAGGVKRRKLRGSCSFSCRSSSSCSHHSTAKDSRSRIKAASPSHDAPKPATPGHTSHAPRRRPYFTLAHEILLRALGNGQALARVWRHGIDMHEALMLHAHATLVPLLSIAGTRPG